MNANSKAFQPALRGAGKKKSGRSTELMIYRNLLVWVPIGAGIISLIRWY